MEVDSGQAATAAAPRKKTYDTSFVDDEDLQASLRYETCCIQEAQTASTGRSSRTAITGKKASNANGSDNGDAEEEPGLVTMSTAICV